MGNTAWLKLKEYAGAIHDGDERFAYTYWVVAAKDTNGSWVAADDSDLPIPTERIVEEREIQEPEESDEEILRREHAEAMAALWSEAFNQGARYQQTRKEGDT